MAVEKGDAARGVPFNEISNGAPGIETLLAVAVRARASRRGRITLERMVDLLATTPARRFGLAAKGALEVGKDADLVLFDPAATRTIRAGRPPPHERLHAVRGDRGRRARSDRSFVRGAPVIRDGAFVGQRGAGRFIERGPIGA